MLGRLVGLAPEPPRAQWSTATIAGLGQLAADRSLTPEDRMAARRAFERLSGIKPRLSLSQRLSRHPRRRALQDFRLGWLS